jgi:hypothetical protein
MAYISELFRVLRHYYYLAFIMVLLDSIGGANTCIMSHAIHVGRSD